MLVFSVIPYWVSRIVVLRQLIRQAVPAIQERAVLESRAVPALSWNSARYRMS